MTARSLRPARLACAALAAAAAATLAACSSSPPARFYTLDAAAATAATAQNASANPAFLIQVPSIGVPEQVAKNQLVVQKNAAQVDVLEEERWASPPADEIRRALSSALTRRLDTIDVADAAYPANVPVYRVSVNIQRFESWPGKHAALAAVWSVRALPSQAVMTCRTDVIEPVQSGYDALVAGHRQAIGELADRIAAGVRAMAAARAPVAARAATNGAAAKKATTATKDAAANDASSLATPVVRCPASPSAADTQRVGDAR
ncbi:MULTISPECIES: PqiC family protein [Burkholderia]|uniref:ABC-type transport auxiliary lipoprotein component domain-containing protein n=1 Tax=Burkholderia mayonis TaxID=1385591 RepID=A0A1B4FBB0_9BURK|nr:MULTISPECIES: PqiC family protein [Burkholderia]AOJ00982.1 hypothetical protein WS70_03355 [Burkholderia mayonis]KVE41927.1 hypothetical protein WS69_27185 [Burkholderia sp. BDU5]KVE49834.1 hypothetical protein WS70_18790 [Burkholderia mayonis]